MQNLSKTIFEAVKAGVPLRFRLADAQQLQERDGDLDTPPKRVHPITVTHRNGKVNYYRAGDERLTGEISKGYKASLKRIFAQVPYVVLRRGFHAA